MIKGYYDFLVESVLFTSDFFNDIIKNIDNKISNDFSELINKDIKTSYNALNTTDKNDQISFMPDNQFQNKFKSGIDIKDLFKEDKNKTSVGRLIRKILKDNGKTYSDNEISEFVNLFKAEWDKDSGIESKIKVIKGEEIKYWYLQDQYCKDTLNGQGTLGKSCMRYSDCQDFFDIYVENPNVCQMLILVDDYDKLSARALIWKTNLGTYLDRIYYTQESDKKLLMDWMRDNLSCEHFYDIKVPSLSVDLEKGGDYDAYPYMDSLAYYNINDGVLYSKEPGSKTGLIYCQDTEGGFVDESLIYCDYVSSSYPEDEVVYSDHHESYLPSDQAVYSEYENDYIHEDSATYLDSIGDYIPSQDVVSVIIDKEGNKDYYPDWHDGIYYEGIERKYYLKELLVKVGRNYYLETNTIKCYELEINDDRFEKIFNVDFRITAEKKCYISIDVSDFYEFEHKDVEVTLVKQDYYKSVYEYVIEDVLDRELIKYDDSDEAVDELEEARIHNAFDKDINIVYDKGGVEHGIKVANEWMDTKSGDVTIFDKICDIYITESEFYEDICYYIRDIIKNKLTEFFKDDYYKAKKEFIKRFPELSNRSDFYMSRFSAIICRAFQNNPSLYRVLKQNKVYKFSYNPKIRQ